MGVKISEYFDRARELGGIKAQMRLTMLTGISTHRASVLEDNPQLLKKLQGAMIRLKREM
ncbi:hypothetical protein GF420_15505 [candidate division GN15 bacterium]|nr:hypothetical protein [candidate division GN15 bacterium]